MMNSNYEYVKNVRMQGTAAKGMAMHVFVTSLVL